MSGNEKSEIKQEILVAVDTVVFTINDGELLTLLVKRKESSDPCPKKREYHYSGLWSLPGGIVDKETDHTTEDTAIRKLQAKTGIELGFLEQLKTYSGDMRDKRCWSVSVAYFILMRYVSELKRDDDNVSEIKWVPVNKLSDYEPLAFDHTVIIEDALNRLREKTRYSLLPAYCLGESFTFNEFHAAVEIILDHPVQKRSLYRRIGDSDALEKTHDTRETSTKKAALFKTNNKTRSYTFDRNLVGVRESD